MAKSIPLKPLTRATPDILPPITIFVDTETRPDPDHPHIQALFLFCYEVWTNNPNGTRRKMIDTGTGWEVDDFYQLLKPYPDCRVVAHNWQFDAAVLKLGSQSTMRRHGYYLPPAEGIFPMQGEYSPFSVKLKWNKQLPDDKNRFHFLCNTNFHKTSLAKIAFSDGLEKLEMPDMLKAPLPTVIKYCERDVEILRESWFLLFRFSDEVANTTPGITVANMTVRMYRARWLPEWENLTIVGNLHKPNITEAENEAYHGGRVETFYQGQPTKPVHKIDANSHYPSAMLGNMPVRFAYHTHPRYLQHYLKKDGMGENAGMIHLAKVTLNIPPDSTAGWLGLEGVFDMERGLIFPAGRFTLIAWQPVLALAQEHGWIEEVHHIWSYEAASIFNQYVRDVYSMRKECKAKGDVSRALLYKYLLNSLYGKFAQGNFGEWQDLLKADPEDFVFQSRAISLDFRPDAPRFRDHENGEVEKPIREYWITPEGIWRYQEAAPGVGPASVNAVAGYITCLARARLWQRMHAVKAAGHNVYMCDTDSIVCDGIPEADWIGKDLGQWEHEGTSAPEDTLFRAPKDYTFNREVKCKGIRKPVMGGSTYTQDQFSRWSTDLMSRRESRNSRIEHGAYVAPITKTITGINKKRVTYGDNAFNDPIVL